MRRPANILMPLAFVLLSVVIGCGQKQTPPDPASEEIRNRVLAAESPARITIGGDSVYSLETVRAFYENRAYRPAWSNETGILPDVDSLLAAINEADHEGLTPKDYHFRASASIVEELRRSQQDKQPLAPSVRADLDLLLTDAFLLYAFHLSEGKIDRDTLQPKWSVGQKETEYASILEHALQSHSTRESLQSLLPKHSLYSGLRELLSSFESMAKRGGWGTVPAGLPLKGGDVGKRVLLLRNRLWASGDLSARSGWSSDEFDSTLVDGVRTFQRRHGLEPSGIADSATIVALNIPIEKRIEQIKVNLERWRWMPHHLGRTHIRVNIPDFRLAVIEADQEVMTMKVVLGVPEWQTPVFSAEMTEVRLNSRWIAPDDILAKELINYMKADSNYLRSNNMTLWRRKEDSLQQMDPRTINIKEMDPKDIDFFLRQEAGPQNIMGQVKFLIPNKYSVYLHDTPYREDFPKNVRMFSHGCIRLEKPFDLAEYVLRDFPEWTRERIDTVVARNAEHSVFLKQAIPVHVLYCTVWKERDGSMQFREDFYGLDRRLAAALRAGREAPKIADKAQ